MGSIAVDCEELAAEALRAFLYVDGADEDVAIAAAAIIRVDPVMAIEAHDGWINKVLGE